MERPKRTLKKDNREVQRRWKWSAWRSLPSRVTVGQGERPGTVANSRGEENHTQLAGKGSSSIFISK